MTNFRKPPARFNKAEANDGVKFEIIDDVTDFNYGTFRCGYFNTAVPRVKQIIEREERKLNAATRARGRKDDHDEMVKGATIFAEAVLLDWDMKDDKDKAIPYSVKAAVEFFTAHDTDEAGKKVYYNDYVLGQLMELSRDILNFQSDASEGDNLGN